MTMPRYWTTLASSSVVASSLSVQECATAVSAVSTPRPPSAIQAPLLKRPRGKKPVAKPKATAAQTTMPTTSRTTASKPPPSSARKTVSPKASAKPTDALKQERTGHPWVGLLRCQGGGPPRQ